MNAFSLTERKPCIAVSSVRLFLRTAGLAISLGLVGIRNKVTRGAPLTGRLPPRGGFLTSCRLTRYLTRSREMCVLYLVAIDELASRMTDSVFRRGIVILYRTRPRLLPTNASASLALSVRRRLRIRGRPRSGQCRESTRDSFLIYKLLQGWACTDRRDMRRS